MHIIYWFILIIYSIFLNKIKYELIYLIEYFDLDQFLLKL